MIVQRSQAVFSLKLVVDLSLPSCYSDYCMRLDVFPVVKLIPVSVIASYVFGLIS